MDAIHWLTNTGFELDDQTVDSLRQLDQQGALSVGWPGSKSALSPRCLVWSRDEIPQLKTTSIVSSRLGRKLDGKDSVFRFVRSAIAQLDPPRQCVLSVRGTTTHSFVTRASRLFGVGVIEVETVSRKQIVAWANSLLQRNESDAVLSVLDLSESKSGPPLRDAIEVLASDQLLVLHARKDGNLHRLLRDRLGASGGGPVYIALGHDELVPPGLAAELMDAGAVGWLLLQNGNSECPMEVGTAKPCAPIIRQVEQQESYFSHCTRRAAGAWPDQPDEEFLDELILGAPARDRSSLSALVRIVSMQRLLATSLSIRGTTPVVSFTAVKLDEISELRTFRSHRGRWDFEPYGISIDREWLFERGARAVTYGDETVWDSMSDSDKPYFQKLDSESIDWSVEQEWRVQGDVDLSAIPPDRAVVFVPTEAEAKHVASISRWPVVVLADKQQ